MPGIHITGAKTIRIKPYGFLDRYFLNHDLKDNNIKYWDERLSGESYYIFTEEDFALYLLVKKFNNVRYRIC